MKPWPDPLFCDAIKRSMFPVHAYESVTTRQGEVVSRLEMTTANASQHVEGARKTTEDAPSLIDSESSRLRYAERGSKVVLRAASSSLASKSSSSSPNLSPFLATSARENSD